MMGKALRVAVAVAVAWSAGEAMAQTAARAERFKIDVPQAVLDDLAERLDRTRWPSQLPGTGWTYGADTAYLRQLADYWQREFDWREQEKRLNRFDHYRATIDGTRIHFVHAKSRDPNAIPVLLLHGWPSSFVQMLDIIPYLTDPAAHGMPNAPSFNVVAASLPGFGFSDIPTKTGVGFATSADLMAKLMHDVLGYQRYGVRGSDLGGVIVRQMAVRHPEQVSGVHLTGIIGAAGATPPLTAAEQKFVDASADRRPVVAAHAQTERDVAGHVEVGEQLLVLEHEADAAQVSGSVGDIVTVDEHRTRVGLEQSGDDPQQRALP